MQITATKAKITDHENHQYGKASGYLFWVKYETLFEKDGEIWINFNDFAAYLWAAGEIDGYTDNDDDGEMWRQEGGKHYSYTFNEFIKDFLSTRDFDEILSEYIGVKLSSVVDDLQPAA